eukprot:gene12238-13499_t
MEETHGEREIAPWAQGEQLRKVERDVLVPKIMRERAKIRCKEYVDEFTKCAKGRTISVVLHCMKENDAMKNCIANQ